MTTDTTTEALVRASDRDTLVIDVYADIACPWCYIGEHRLLTALARRPEVTAVRRWRPFQLQPGLPAGGVRWADFVPRKFGSAGRARVAFAQVTAVGAADGLHFDFDRVVSAPNTADAHRLILLASRRGDPWAMAEGLFRAYFAEGRDLNDPEQLVALAVSAGLEAAEVRAYLSGDEGAAEVRAAQDEAHRRGVQAVPSYVFDGRRTLSGAQPVEVFLGALNAAG